jgi:hypothetical protein
MWVSTFWRDTQPPFSGWETEAYVGLAITQAVSRRLLIDAARVRAQIRSCGICGAQSDAGTGFLRLLRFPLPIIIPPTASHSSSSSTIGQTMADIPSGLGVTCSRYIDSLRTGRPRGQISSPSRVKDFLFSTSSRPALGSSQPPIQWVPGTLSPRIKRLGREA